MNEPGNRWSPQVSLNKGLKAIATAGDTVEHDLSADQRQAQALSASIIKLNTGIDNLRKQLQPRLWRAEVDFTVARTYPRLAVDLPVALTWFQTFFTSGQTSPGTSNLYFYDQDGATLITQTTLQLPAFGPSIAPAQGILFRKNISIYTDSTANFPFYVICGGYTL